MASQSPSRAPRHYSLRRKRCATTNLFFSTLLMFFAVEMREKTCKKYNDVSNTGIKVIFLSYSCNGGWGMNTRLFYVAFTFHDKMINVIG